MNTFAFQGVHIERLHCRYISLVKGNFYFLEMKSELNLEELCMEVISCSCSSPDDVQSLPLPPKLKNRVCRYY